MTEVLRILSLGAGVQSSTVLLMAARGELEYEIDGAIFSDTQWEPKVVYDWLAFLEEQVAGVIPHLPGERRQHPAGVLHRDVIG